MEKLESCSLIPFDAGIYAKYVNPILSIASVMLLGVPDQVLG